MLGVWVNPLAVVLGAVVGSLAGGRIPERFRRTIMQGLGLAVILIGVAGAAQTQNVLAVIIALVIGAVIGEAVGVEEGMARIGDWAQKKVSRPGDASFGQGFVSATLLFCVGSMAVVGSMNAGLRGDSAVLLAKSALDGVTALLFASTMGMGVALSAAPLLVYQGGIALLAGLIGPVLSETVVTEMSATGSLLILGLGLNMLGCTKEPLKVGNLLPAMFLPILLVPIAEWIGRLFG